jgi:hypothetical protein
VNARATTTQASLDENKGLRTDGKIQSAAVPAACHAQSSLLSRMAKSNPTSPLGNTMTDRPRSSPDAEHRNKHARRQYLWNITGKNMEQIQKDIMAAAPAVRLDRSSAPCALQRAALRRTRH